jgi:hypothetical protein
MNAEREAMFVVGHLDDIESISQEWGRDRYDARLTPHWRSGPPHRGLDGYGMEKHNRLLRARDCLNEPPFSSSAYGAILGVACGSRL